MPTVDGIHVDILTNNIPLHEYFDADDDTGNDHTTSTCYVEAVGGAKFCIRISVVDGFNCLGANGLEIFVKLDGAELPTSYIPSLNLYGRAYSNNTGKYTVTNLQLINLYCSETQKWSKSELAFKFIELDETIANRPETISKAAELGCITVIVRRIIKIPKRPEPIVGRDMDFVDRVSEKMLKGKAIYEQVAIVNVPNTAGPLTCDFDIDALRGRAGNLLEFNFLYRSRRALQILSLIPHTPSPEPSQEERIRVLQERVEDLERSLRDATKSEEREARRIKRELNDSDTYSGCRTRVKRNEEIEVIELSD